VADIRAGRPGNYAEQARTYDLTRGASPTVVRAVTRFLGPPAGRSLVDLAGGTGNYAQVFAARGFRVLVLDAEPAMLAHAARKLRPGHLVAADVLAPPLRDASIDCEVMINSVHLFADPGRALAEARRVVRAGPVVLTAFTQENLAPLFVFEYFDRTDEIDHRPSNAEVEELLVTAGFRGVQRERYVYTDAVDGSLNALHTNALYLAGPAYLRNTSLWHRVDEQTRQRALERLARDLRSGLLEERVRTSFELAATHGHGTVFAAWP
jgi:ubiquinone/menaquinone biosynthesis C-methylase UbiE